MRLEAYVVNFWFRAQILSETFYRIVGDQSGDFTVRIVQVSHEQRAGSLLASLDTRGLFALIQKMRAKVA
jgi:hypothetical protein